MPVLFILAALAAPTASASNTVLLSDDTHNVKGDLGSFQSVLTPNAKWVVFFSEADNLVPGDFNAQRDIFLRSRIFAEENLCSVPSGGTPQANDQCVNPSVSANARFVLFESNATNLDPADSTGSSDIYLHDLKTDTTELISVDSSGTHGNGTSTNATLSNNGRFIVFQSTSTNLVAGDANGVSDVFLHDRKTGVTRRISVDPDGNEANGASFLPRLSASGRFVVFDSNATNLVAGDTNGKTDIFVRDLKTGTTSLVSVGIGGAPANGFSDDATISSNGRFVCFTSAATNLDANDADSTNDVFVRDLKLGTTVLVSAGLAGSSTGSPSFHGRIAQKGRFVAFTSDSATLVASDTNAQGDVFVRDLHKATTLRASVDSAGAEGTGNLGADRPSISANGRFVSFEADFTNLVPDDTNSVFDIFVRDTKP
jgi:Tol biopolymer transport system component